MKKLGLFFYAFCACALLFVSCSGSNGTGEINFEITKADFEKFTQIYKDNSNNGDFERVGIVTVSLSGDYNETKSIIIPNSDIEMVSKYNLSFDGIPVGKSVYVDVDFSRKETTSDGLTSINQTNYGYSKEVKVRSGKNVVPVKLWRSPSTTNFGVNGYYRYSKGQNASGEDGFFFCDAGSDITNEANFINCWGTFDFCTSLSGNVYYIAYDGASCTIKGTSWDAGKTTDFLNKEGNSPSIQRILCDYATGNCYVYGTCEWSYTPYDIRMVIGNCGDDFYSLQSDTTSDPYYVSFEDDNLEDDYLEPELLTVYNDKFYVLVNHYNTEESETDSLPVCDARYVYVYSITSDGLVRDDSKTINADCLLNREVTDMTCHEGSLYFLTRECRMESNDNDGHSMFSYGGLYKYDIEDEQWSELGTNHTQKKKEEMTKIGCYFYTATTSPEILYVDGSTKPAVFIGSITDNNGNVRNAWEMFPDIVDTPSPVSGVSKTAFYGPEKFVAIKPKTLVIADDGFAFYTDENGALSYKNVNRFVTVDLQKFAISDVEETDANFNENFPDESFDNPYTVSCCYYSFKEYLGDKKLRQSNGYNGTEYSGDEIYFGFSCKD